MSNGKLDVEDCSSLKQVLKEIAAKHNPMYPNKRTNRERESQTEMLNNDMLPTEINYPMGVNVKAKLEELGCQFIGEVADDPLFQYVKLPKSWKIIPIKDSCWTNIIDERGNTIIKIFYRNSLCGGRSAFMNVSLHLF